MLSPHKPTILSFCTFIDKFWEKGKPRLSLSLLPFPMQSLLLWVLNSDQLTFFICKGKKINSNVTVWKKTYWHRQLRLGAVGPAFRHQQTQALKQCHQEICHFLGSVFFIQLITCIESGWKACFLPKKVWYSYQKKGKSKDSVF